MISKYHITRYNQKLDKPSIGTRANNESNSNSNADTCCLGKHFIIMQMTSRTADTYPFDDAYEPNVDVSIVTGATAWTTSMDQMTYILKFYELLYYGNKLNQSLINPNQLHHNGVDFWDNPYESSHKLSIQIDQGPRIPLTYEGAELKFATHVPI